MELKLARPWDPAIDREAMKADGDRWDRFLETSDAELAIVIEGEALCVFHCVPLTWKQRRSLDGLMPEAKRIRAFSWGVRHVANKPVRGGSPKPWQRRSIDKPMSEAELESFGENAVQQLGEAIIAHSFCEEGEPVFVPLLATSQHALIAAGLASQHRRAEQTKTDAPSR